MRETRTDFCQGHEYKFVCDMEVHSATAFSYEDEKSVRESFWTIKGGDTVLDIGAALGTYSITALAMGAKRVIAWSPEWGSDLFLESLVANGFQDRCQVITGGLWSEPGYLFVNDGRFAFSKTKPVQNSFRVDALDSLNVVNSLDKVDWVKMDVEGAEFEILKGAQNLISKHKPNFLIENHLFIDPTLYGQCKSLLAQFGYQETSNAPYHRVSHSVFKYSGV